MDAALPYTTSLFYNERSLTTGSITWSPGAWLRDQIYDVAVTRVVTEVMARAGWKRGNPLAVQVHPVSGTGQRDAWSIDGALLDGAPAHAPQLLVTYRLTNTRLTTYTYDAANRLSAVDGQPYTWDNNGNLINDGSANYLYDRANRLISTTLGGATSLFNYNGDGARLKQVVAGVVTTYTQDLVAPLPVVLQAKTGVTTTKYLYGLGTRPLAQNSTVWEYLLPDALGSVRQIADANGNITLAKSYEPYGGVLTSTGAASSMYGFTGEQLDNQTGLLYLRARYMQPRLGIFLAHDPWGGDMMRPGSMNGYSYVEGDPINRVDPTGFQSGNVQGAAYLIGCINLHTAGPVLGNIFPDATTAGEAVARCKAAYNKANWNQSLYGFQLGQELPTKAHDLFGWYLFEWRGRYNSDRLFFDANQPLTHELAKNAEIFSVREGYYNGDPNNGGPTLFKFGAPDYGLSLFESLETAGNSSLAIGFFMGSFYYQIKELSNDRIGFRIDNDTGLASGTHIANRFEDEGYRDNVERLIERNPDLANKPLQELLRDTERYKLLSILRNRTGAETGGQGGATLYQTYYWTEKRACNLWERWFGDPTADMQVWEWSDFTSKTIDPPGWPAQ